MLTLITGRPGTGKTQYAISRFIIEERVANPNRPIFANIKGLKLDKLQALTGGDVVGPSPDDWRECPDGSLLIYDEAQQEHLFPATGRPGAPNDERLLRFDTHRHRGFDIVLISQDASLVHHWARKFVGRFIHLERHDGLESTHVSQWEEVVDPSDYHAKQRADKSTRRMDAKVWEVYDSATIHTHKFVVPQGAKNALRFAAVCAIFLVALASGLWWYMQPEAKPELQADLPSEPTLVQSVLPVALASDWRSAPTVAPINGCAASEIRCRCWDFDGRMLEISEGMCRNLAEGIEPMPLDLNRFQGRGGAAERVGRDAPPLAAPPVAASSVVGLGAGIDRSIAPVYVPPDFSP